MTRTKFLFVLLFVLLTMPAALRAGDISLGRARQQEPYHQTDLLATDIFTINNTATL